jgi:hypothetical protein
MLRFRRFSPVDAMSVPHRWCSRLFGAALLWIFDCDEQGLIKLQGMTRDIVLNLNNILSSELSWYFQLVE